MSDYEYDKYFRTTLSIVNGIKDKHDIKRTSYKKILLLLNSDYCSRMYLKARSEIWGPFTSIYSIVNLSNRVDKSKLASDFLDLEIVGRDIQALTTERYYNTIADIHSKIWQLYFTIRSAIISIIGVENFCKDYEPFLLTLRFMITWFVEVCVDRDDVLTYVDTVIYPDIHTFFYWSQIANSLKEGNKKHAKMCHDIDKETLLMKDHVWILGLLEATFGMMLDFSRTVDRKRKATSLYTSSTYNEDFHAIRLLFQNASIMLHKYSQRIKNRDIFKTTLYRNKQGYKAVTIETKYDWVFKDLL